MSTDKGTVTEGKTQKLSEEELAKFHELNNQINQAVAVVGDLELSKVQIKAKKENVLTQLQTLVDNRQELIKELSEAYGEGSINLETGEITTV